MRRRRGIAAAASALVVAILALNNVPDGYTEEDIVYGDRILQAAGYEGPKRGFGDLALFENQIRAIAAVQDAVISMAKLDEEIPFDHAREPRDIVRAEEGALLRPRPRNREDTLGNRIQDAPRLGLRHGQAQRARWRFSRPATIPMLSRR